MRNGNETFLVFGWPNFHSCSCPEPFMKPHVKTSTIAVPSRKRSLIIFKELTSCIFHEIKLVYANI